MFDPFALARPIDRDTTMDEEDVFKAKSALKSLGHFKTPKHGLTRFPDEQMIDGVKSFQRARGLREDGVMNPGGPTHTRINQDLRRKQVGSSAASQGERRGAGLLSTMRPSGQDQSNPSVGSNPSRTERHTERKETQTAVAAPPIVIKIAQMMGMTIAAAWAWWKGMSGADRARMRARVNGDKSDRPSREDCDDNYFNVDIPTCNAISRKRGKQATARCFASANARYGACLSGVPVDRLPPLDVWNN